MENPLTVTVDAEATVDLVEVVRWLTLDEVFDLIVHMDAMAGDWDFSEKLYNHFKKLHEECLVEEKEADNG